MALSINTKSVFLSKVILGDMKKFNLILVLIAFCFMGCKDDKNKIQSEESKVEKKTQNPTSEKKLIISTLTKWPDEITGCSCSFSKSKADFKEKKYIYVGDFENKVFMMINGKQEQFKLEKSNVSTSPDTPTETWSNENYLFTYSIKKVSQSGETQQFHGTLTLKSKDGQSVKQNIYGECGC